MLLQINKKIFYYFFLFIILTTLNNESIKNFSLPKINQIKVTGLENNESIELLKNLKVFQIKNLFFLDQSQIKEIFNSNNLIENYTIFKRYPSTLEIKIYKTKFLANTNKNGIFFLVGSNSKLIQSKKIKKNIPFIFGDFEIQNFLKLKKNIDNSKLNYQDIKNIYFFPSGRWDIEMKSGILIKLSKYKIVESLDLSIEILLDNEFDNIDLIDLRQNNQVVING